MEIGTHSVDPPVIHCTFDEMDSIGHVPVYRFAIWKPSIIILYLHVRLVYLQPHSILSIETVLQTKSCAFSAAFSESSQS